MTAKSQFRLEYRGKPTRSALVLEYAKKHPLALPTEIAKELRKRQVSVGFAAKVLKHFNIKPTTKKPATPKPRAKRAPVVTQVTQLADINQLQAARAFIDNHCDGDTDAAVASVMLLSQLRTVAK